LTHTQGMLVCNPGQCKPRKFLLVLLLAFSWTAFCACYLVRWILFLLFQDIPVH